jgi:NitT/TauT family transport system substrate-binding protein
VIRKCLILSLTLILALSALGGALAQETDSDLPTLRIAVLPVLNTLPLYVAQAEGYYGDHGVNVELVPFNAAREQQVALQAGEVDGANTDLAVLNLLVNGGVDMRAVRSEPIREPYFAIVAGAESGISSVDDLRGVPIAISQNTIIEYLTTEMLTNAGFTEDEIVYEEVPAIPVRLELLNSGQVAAATLPEPLVTLATQLQSATLIANDADSAFVPTVLALSKQVIDEQPEAVAGFLAAYEDAVRAINADGERFREVMTTNILIPEPLQATFPVPTFPTANVVSEEDAALVSDWMVSVGLLDAPVAYDALVDASFLPLDTIAATASAFGNFNTLFSALETAGLTDALNVEGPITVFAPTDSAFETLDAELQQIGSSLDTISAERLAEILQYHIVEGEYLLDDLIEQGSGTLQTLGGQEINFHIMGGELVLNDGVTIALEDVRATNGVIHVVDRVLLPPTE